MKAWRLVASVFLLALAGGACGQTLTTLWQFSGTNGGNPLAGLVQGSDSYFYGTTWDGGTSTNCPNGCGTVFRISSQGTLTTLWDFVGTNGYAVVAGLVEGSDGYFYGTTANGGTNKDGTVFKITPQGTLITLGQFNGANGQYPYSGLVQGSDGNFYGMTHDGGTNDYGTVFKITSQGTLATLWQFSGSDGEYPYYGSLLQDADGNFYGTTWQGGLTNNQCTLGNGTVFNITPQGTLTTLYEFGCSPSLAPTPDGGNPTAGLVLGSDGNFYGTTANGGTNKYGTVFRITPQGTLTTLWQFSGADGRNPNSGLVQGTDGNLYGTTFGGGTSTFCSVNGINGCGTVFKISVPLTHPADQICSAQVDSSGTNLVFSIPSVAYETYQLQFSLSMNPTNWSNVPGVSVTNSIGALLTLTNFGGASGPQGFYRFAITP